MNVISFCVWGSGSAYYYGVLENAIFIHEKIPTFQTWIYHNNTLPNDIKECLLQLPSVKLFSMTDNSNVKNLLWRFIPAFDKNVNICLVRDADSRIGEKEITAVLEWIKSDKDFHIMRDSSWHKSKILAGMWGCRNKILLPYYNSFFEYMNNEENNNLWTTDELFLEKYIYPYIVNNSFIHASSNKFEKHAVNFTVNNDKIEVGKINNEIKLIKLKFPNLTINKLYRRTINKLE